MPFRLRAGRKAASLECSRGGWHVHLDILRDRLAGNMPEPFWARHNRLEIEYADRLSDRLEAMHTRAAD